LEGDATMKGLVRLVFLVALILVATTPSKAKTDLTVTGQMRSRGMAVKTTFAKNANFDTFDELRSRLKVQATVNDNTQAVIQLQDSRVLGEGGFSGTLKDGGGVDLHQGYIQIDNLFGKGWGSKAGRFEFVKGNERVFGAVGWSNVSRSWDGGTLWWDADKHKITLFSMKKAEMHAEAPPTLDENRDFDIGGAYVTIKNLNWDLYMVYELDANNSTVGVDSNDLDRISFGTYYQRTSGQLDFTLNGVIQTGKISDKKDISAAMFAFEAGYSLQDERNTRVALGIDFQSGDDGSDTTKSKKYSGLYPTAHKFQGYMDYFTGVPDYGLMDLMFRFKTDITKGWTVAADIHLFTADKDYMWDHDNNNTTAKVASTDVGSEVDITVKTNRVAGVGLQWGLSYFGAKDSFAGMTDKDPGLWGYGMATVNF